MVSISKSYVPDETLSVPCDIHTADVVFRLSRRIGIPPSMIVGMAVGRLELDIEHSAEQEGASER